MIPLFHTNPTPKQPLNLPRNDAWIPPSRYYGDRYARTMEEAFGPYARLHVERRSFLDRYFGYVVAIGFALLLGVASWACNSTRLSIFLSWLVAQLG